MLDFPSPSPAGIPFKLQVNRTTASYSNLHLLYAQRTGLQPMRFITRICIVLPPATRDSECVGSSPLRVLCPETQFFLPRPLLLAWPTARPRACLRRRGAAGRCISQRFTVLPHRIIISRLISNVNSRNTSDSTRRFRMRICAYCATPSLGSRVYHSIRTPCNLLGRRRCLHGYARVRDSSGARIW